MSKERNILINYILYFITFFVICLIGISGVFADTTIDTSTWLNVTGRNWSISGQEFYTGTQSFNNDVLLNHYNVTGGRYTPPDSYDYITYSFFEHSTSSFNPCNSSNKFTASFRLLFSTPSFVNYIDSVKWGNENCSISNKNTTTGWVDVSCVASPSTGNYTDIFVNYMPISGTLTSNLYITRNIDIACSLNTDAIINNDNANTQNIINNNNQNNQNIINNQNENTDKIIEENKKNFNSCRDSVNLLSINNVNITSNGISIKSENGVITLNGTATGTLTYDFILNNVINSSLGTLTKSLNATGQYTGLQTSLRGENSEISVGLWSNNGANHTNTLSGDAYRFRIQINNGITVNTTIKPQIQIGNTATEYEEYGKEICVNKLDEQNKTSKGIFGKLKDLFDTLFSNDDADVSGLDNMVGWLPPGPVDSIINLPLSLFNSLTNTLTGTCTPVSLTIPFVNQTLVLPCFDAYMSQYLTGFNTLWTFVGVTLSVFILYYYLLALYKWVDDTLTFRENNLPGYYGDNWGGGA